MRTLLLSRSVLQPHPARRSVARTRAPAGGGAPRTSLFHVPPRAGRREPGVVGLLLLLNERAGHAAEVERLELVDEVLARLPFRIETVQTDNGALHGGLGGQTPYEKLRQKSGSPV
jgi:hypothetical protein